MKKTWIYPSTLIFFEKIHLILSAYCHIFAVKTNC